MTLAECGDTLSIDDVIRVIGISRAQYFALKAHDVFPIEPLPGLGGKVRYSKAAVERYLTQSQPMRVVRRKVS